MAIQYGDLTMWQINRQLKEYIRQHATRLISSISYCPYPERLRILNLPSLNYQRLRGDMIFFVSNHSSQFRSIFTWFVSTALTTSTRGRNFKYFNPRCGTRYRCNFFSYRTIDNWNNLPAHIVSADSINFFKNLLDNYYFDSLFIV